VYSSLNTLRFESGFEKMNEEKLSYHSADDYLGLITKRISLY